MKKSTLISIALALFAAVSCTREQPVTDTMARASEEDSGGSGGGGDTPGELEGGYLFAHTGKGGNYYKLFYAASRDGITWKALNKGASPMPTYWGFPYITRDGKGTWWLIGTSNGAKPHFPIVWWSDDMVTWKHKDLPASILDLPEEYENDTNSYGAMKIFYDAPSQQFIITWHASEKQYPSGEGGRNHWKSMRTFYILTKDFETFTPATKLFNFSGKEVDMAQIDASIHYYGGKYYAVIKDERWTTASGDGYVYGKTVRIAVSDRLTGPYANPGPPVTPAWREAPTMVTSPGGNWYYMYVEDYTQHVYMLYRSQTLTSNTEWEQVTDFVPPPGDNCRHGCVVPVDGVTWQKLMQAYDISVDDVPVPGKTAESTEDLPQYDYSW